MEVRLLQAYVIDLSDQNDILMQTVEELQNRTVLKMAAVEAEFQRPTPAQRPMPAESLSRSTATQTVSPWPGQRMKRRSLGAAEEPLPLETQLLQREEAVHGQEEANAELLEKEQRIQGLQEALTALHHNLSCKDAGLAGRLQGEHLLATQLHALQHTQLRSRSPCFLPVPPSLYVCTWPKSRGGCPCPVCRRNQEAEPPGAQRGRWLS
ncbi:uncharacterized protein LOC134408889 [Elgaria multicarinata webbii]|uniref:uncharacterized protein LOC134408889 n=1 Tax=Elgaria multicarinata webbii TaxID=159646 RepID=UPI002FCD5738